MKRAYGSGSLTVRRGKWFGQWRVGTKLQSKALGPVRAPGTREGLTRKMAEARLRDLMTATAAITPLSERVTVGEAGESLIRQLTADGRKTSTLEVYESMLRVHLVPHFRDRAISTIDRRAVESFIAAERAAGAAPKSIRNYVGFLHSVFKHAEIEEWVASNPVKLARKPRAGQSDPDIRFLDQEDVEALLRAVPEDDRGPVERVLYLAAAMTGMRQGELLALRWQDVDWTASRVRVRRNWVRGEFGTPKSRRSSRSVPLAPRLAAELDALHRRTAYPADDALVFGHPHSGLPLERSKLLKRFKAALARAGVREVRMHDLRHTFGTRMAAQGVPLRTLQEWMGHRDLSTTQIYADYQPDDRQEAALVEAAFAGGHQSVINTRESQLTSDHLT